MKKVEVVAGLILKSGMLLCVQRGVNRYQYISNKWEFPGGKLEQGEDPLLGAQRELREETGYTAKHWQFLCTIHNAIAYSDEHLDIYLAEGLTAGERQLDQGEFLDVFTLPLDELLEWIRVGKVIPFTTKKPACMQAGFLRASLRWRGSKIVYRKLK